MYIYIYIYDLKHMIILYIVELRTPAMPVGVGGGKERGGFHLNLRTWHAASCILLQSWHCGLRVAEAASRAMADSEREEWNSRSCSCSCCRCRCRRPCCRRRHCRRCRRCRWCRRLRRWRRRRRRCCCYCCCCCCCLVLLSLSLLSL